MVTKMHKDLFDKKSAVVDMVRKINDDKLAFGKKYVYVSYVAEDATDAYQVVEILLENGIPLRINEDIDVQMTSDIVDNEDCLLMVTLVSKRYIYSQKALIDQYFRFKKSVRDHLPDKRQLPCLVIDLSNNRCKYKDDINEELVSTIVPEIMDKTVSDLIREGLEGLYGMSNGNFAKLIDREIEEIDDGDIDSIRRQMSFILDYDGHLDNVTNLKDILSYERNTIKKINRQGIQTDDELKSISTVHFEEWGKAKYRYNQGSLVAEIISSENNMYIKKGSLIEENPALERSSHKELKALYKELLLNGSIVLSSIPGKLEALDNITKVKDIEEAHIFVTGKSEANCGRYWVNEKSGKSYSEENGQ